MDIVRSLRHLIVMLLSSCLLLACGGGGSSNTAPTADAGAAQSVLAGAVATLDGRASADAQGDSLHYAWVLTSKPPTSAASLAGADTSTPTLATDVAGSYVATLTVSDGSLASSPSTVTVTVLPTDTLAILADKSEPLSDSVQLSLSGSTAGAPVSWYVDLARIGTDASATWDSSTVLNGSHLVMARIQVATDTVVEIRRTVNVVNSGITLASYLSGTTGTIRVDIQADSPSGIASVSGSLDGAPATTLYAPNACLLSCGGSDYTVYEFTVDAALAGSGPHTMVVIATDGAGDTRQSSIAVPVSNAPTLALGSPADGTIVYGSLNVAGSFATDKPGAVTVVASLGSVPILQTTAQDFSTSYDLAGITPGSYVLTVQATNSANETTTVTRSIVVSSSSALAYAPIFSLGANARMLAAEGDRLLYVGQDQLVRLRDTAANTEVLLQGASPDSFLGDWTISGGRTYASGRAEDCEFGGCVYQWQADGTRTNLTLGNPWALGAPQEHPVAHDGYVIWCNNGARSYTLYAVSSGTYTQVGAPADVVYAGNTDFDFTVTGGVVHVIYWGQTSSVSASFASDVYLWDSGTGSSTRRSTPGLTNAGSQIDGARVAWSQSPAGWSGNSTSLVTQPLAGGTTTDLSDTMNIFLLRDGVLAWMESGGATRAVKASTAAGTTTLSVLTSSWLYGSGGGFVAYGEAARTYDWNAATSHATLLLDAAPGTPLQNGNRLYFTLGQTQTLYKLTLH